MKQPRIHIRWCIIGDIVASVISWIIFYFVRKNILGELPIIGIKFYIGLLAMPFAWICLFTLTGTYTSLYTKSRLFEFFHTAIVCALGAILILFFFLLNDAIGNNSIYYKEFLSLFSIQLFFVYLSRLLLLTTTKNQLKKESVFFNTLLIGSEKSVANTYHLINSNIEKTGFNVIGFINTNGQNLTLNLPINCLGQIDALANLIKQNNVEEVIIAIEKRERNLLEKILQLLSDKNVNVKITADSVDIMTGAVQTSNVMGVPLIDLHTGLLPSWQQNIKRLLDVGISLISIILLLPLIIYTALRVRLSSAGPIFYFQERIGYKGEIFTMYKFRSMVVDAEKNGPLLSNDEDTRITKWGKIMRKWRLDELPQLINILKGEMSLVGPRPERQFYIDKIVEQHPEYKYLLKVKPGLSSWGMVKFGYASTIDEMIERMQYDLIYIENASLLIDFKIMMHTIKIIWGGKGK